MYFQSICSDMYYDFPSDGCLKIKVINRYRIGSY